MTLENLASNVWYIEHPMKVFGAEFGTRTTILGLSSGKLAIHSPGPLTQEHVAEIEGLGEVGYVISPSLMHHLFLRKAAELWPDARVFVPRGLMEKIGDVPRAEVMESDGDIEGEIFWVRAAGMPMVNEHVFYHQPARTVIITDLIFNFRDHPQWWLRTFMTLNKAYGQPLASRLLRTAIKRPERLRESLETVMSWEWDALGLCHGHPIPRGGYEAFQKAYGFILEGKS
ncbi:MAG: DUF4336 domain-containing protein [Bradymonadaceae bacterium]